MATLAALRAIGSASEFIYDNLAMQKMEHALVCGAGGFIGSHLVKRLKNEDSTASGS